MRSVGTRSALYMVSAVVSVAASIATLPLATLILGPEDYGAYALVMSVSTCIQALAAALQTYVLPAFIGTIGSQERKDLIFTCLANVVAFATLLSAIVAIGIDVGAPDLLAQIGADRTAVIAAALGTISITPWLLAIDLFAIDGRAGAFALITVAQAVATACALLVGLFVFRLGATSLYVSFLVGSSVAGLAALAAMQKDIYGRYSRTWLRKMLDMAPPAIGQRLAESGIVILERSIIGIFASARAVGLYTHSQLYSSAGTIALNAVSRGMLPLNLKEARDLPPLFLGTYSVWLPAQLLVALGAIEFALAGDQIISLLTNGKFTDAHLMAYLLIVALAVKTGGKPESAYLSATGNGTRLANLNTISTAIGAGSLLVLVPLLGALGAAVAALLRALAFRGGLWIAGREWKIPFQDGPLFVGLACSALVGALVFTSTIPTAWRHIAACLLLTVAVLLTHKLLQTLSREESAIAPPQPIQGAAQGYR